MSNITQIYVTYKIYVNWLMCLYIPSICMYIVVLHVILWEEKLLGLPERKEN